jgi:hypothetical protein
MSLIQTQNEHRLWLLHHEYFSSSRCTDRYNLDELLAGCDRTKDTANMPIIEELDFRNPYFNSFLPL